MVQRCGPAPAGLGVGATILCAADVNAARVVRRGRWDGITHRVVDGPAIGTFGVGTLKPRATARDKFRLVTV